MPRVYCTHLGFQIRTQDVKERKATDKVNRGSLPSGTMARKEKEIDFTKKEFREAGWCVGPSQFFLIFIFIYVFFVPTCGYLSVIVLSHLCLAYLWVIKKSWVITIWRSRTHRARYPVLVVYKWMQSPLSFWTGPQFITELLIYNL